MKTIALLALLLTPLAWVACHKVPPPSPQAPSDRPPITGSRVPVANHPFPRFLRVTGQLNAKNDAIVAANALGLVVAAPVERGTLVAVGDVLARLDDRHAKLALAEAEASRQLAQARLALAKNEQERNQPLAEKKAVAAADYQKFLTEVAARLADLAAAQARRDLAQQTLDDSVIRAVFAGVVAERLVAPGQYLTAASPVARVVETATLRLLLNVAETDVAALEVGQTIAFTTAAFPRQTFAAKLAHLGPALREASRDLIVEAAVDNADGRLRPGFFCNADILLRTEPALAIPTDAIRTDGSLPRVFAITSDLLLSERLVDLGASRDGFTEIRAGLAPGDAVLAHPGPEAADGRRFQAAP